MDIKDWVALIASLAAFVTALGGLFYQKHHMEMERKEFIVKYGSPDSRMRGYLVDLPEPQLPPADFDQADAGLPYQAGAPIRNWELFYGRQKQISDAMNCIVNRNQMASMSIYGARRSGKTSFLYHLSSIFGPDHYPQIVPVFLDSQSVISSDNNFYAYMLRETSAALDVRSKAHSHPPEIPREVEFETLCTFLEQASGKGWRFVFLLDEFDRLANHKAISGEPFFSSLRSLILKGKVSWITASFRAVYMPGTTTSPFVNIVQETTWLGPLSLEDARALVSDPARRAGRPFEKEDMDLIISLAGRMPFMLQKASLLLYKLHLAGSMGQAGRLRLTNEFKLETQTYFQSVFSLLSEQESEALFRVALQKEVKIPESLEQYGFVETDAGKPQVLGQTFEDYLYQKAKEAGLTNP
jgi:hypothetical protein